MQTAPTQPTTSAPPPAAVEQSDAAKIARAQTLLRSSFQLADDESVPALTWGERDDLCRNLNEAMRLIREVHPTTEPTERAN